MAAIYETIIIGGGIAGLQAAIQLGRMGHRILVVDSEAGRSVLCKSYHNVIGWPDGISGQELRRMGRQQAARYGAEFLKGEALSVNKEQELFAVWVRDEAAANEKTAYRSHTLLVATGVMDRFPQLPGLVECLGLSIYVCPDCDGYEIAAKRTIVLGSGDTGARMALTLSYFSDKLVYVNHEQRTVDPDLMLQLEDKRIECIGEPIGRILTAPGKEGVFQGVELASGRLVPGEKAFIAFGGNEVRSSIVAELGIQLYENKHIVTDPRSKMTNVRGVWAAGDIGVHSEQLTIAMGEGSQAAIWIHKELLRIAAGRDEAEPVRS